MRQVQIKSELEFKKIINNKKFSKIFILTGKKSFFFSGANQLIKKNILSYKKVFFFFKKSKIPTINELYKINSKFVKFKPNLILAIGGGSVIDYAKILNSLEIDKLLEKNIKNKFHINFKTNTKLITIPTTAGSGSESTSSSVIYINKKKYSIENILLLPNYYFLYPNLIINLSKKIKSSSGFDAIAQAVESIISIKANNKSIKFAKASLKLSLNNFIKYIKKPNKTNALKMLKAANLAGKAINISKTTAPHAVSYPFTSHFNIDHGHAVSLYLEKFIKFNFINLKYLKNNSSLKKKYNLIFKIFQAKNIMELSKKLKKICKESGLETNLSKIGIDLKKSINLILSNINYERLSNNPIKLCKKNVKNVLLSK